MVMMGNKTIRMPVPKMPVPLVEENDKASAVQMTKARTAEVI